jgi:hypothetical protein
MSTSKKSTGASEDLWSLLEKEGTVENNDDGDTVTLFVGNQAIFDILCVFNINDAIFDEICVQIYVYIYICIYICIYIYIYI